MKAQAINGEHLRTKGKKEAKKNRGREVSSRYPPSRSEKWERSSRREGGGKKTEGGEAGGCEGDLIE